MILHAAYGGSKILKIDGPALQAKMGFVPFLINLQREQIYYGITEMNFHADPPFCYMYSTNGGIDTLVCDVSVNFDEHSEDIAATALQTGNKDMKKTTAVGVMLCLLFTSCLILIYFIKSSSDNGETPEPVNIIEILETTPYDAEKIYEEGLAMIALIADNPNRKYEYWKESTVTDFSFLHSFETGHKEHGLFEILGNNGQRGFMIYDCRRKSPAAYGEGMSPFMTIAQKIKNGEVTELPEHVMKTEAYYFYSGGYSYGYGIINENGLIDIYNMVDIGSGRNADVLTDVDFSSEKN